MLLNIYLNQTNMLKISDHIKTLLTFMFNDTGLDSHKFDQN